MKDYLKEFEEALDAIVRPALEDWDDDDNDLGDDDDADTGFSREAMFVQLGRILDSQGNPNPVDSVTTDDGQTVNVEPNEAKMLRMLATTDQIKPMIRDKFIKDIQNSSGLNDFLGLSDPKAMTQVFLKKYMGR